MLHKESLCTTVSEFFPPGSAKYRLEGSARNSGIKILKFGEIFQMSVEISREISSDRLPDWGSFCALPTLPPCSLACKNVKKKRLLGVSKIILGVPPWKKVWETLS